MLSKFAEQNIGKAVYKNEDQREKIKKLIDDCRQNMDSRLEKELAAEIALISSTDDEFEGKSYEYHYDLYETVKTFNDYLCITFLHLSNILTYPNETFYEKYEKKQIRIKPDDAIKMANQICLRMQHEFEDIILENFPIKETVQRVTQAERKIQGMEFNSDEIITVKNKKETKTKITKDKIKN